MIIRDAVEDERSYIREQRINAYMEHASKIPEEHWNVLREAIASDADTQPGVEQIVAVIEGEIVGSVVLFPPKTDAYKGLIADVLEDPEIRMLAVSPEDRGKGVATALITECIQRAKMKGSPAIGLHTSDFMESAIKLYENLGFKRLPQYDFEPTDDGIIVKAFRISF
ncbi:GNAT family N-acetyltransferase [Bacillus sp. EB600]|uniref:GNAT family N-acetyltransferase n=1 Tax=Bacillus sp. EB600 TaxID=2806345 RepID=UPI0021088806|nr:GNAT family N-acetyltransferase [Bacillus sp. EB600]MCQ6279625.1 GNAT family N-acetyltransferase [Bacillus sp. EB600]